ncbi:vWA domain-containing protein [Profundibacterium mesophilum]|uniref:Membrane protein n=1 Tax=Profundibacterium mesophilum KAUST100406-0324 TaxID=1037889 RepID=A0A921NYH7_9RHOB|nr:VWA domain-containing protein [Profundibacterium mesophilum]KAF0677034.1 putative membrane protein [Profundibacterium mesophilum KAUST100406-0324]
MRRSTARRTRHDARRMAAGMRGGAILRAAADERGSITILALFFFVCILVVGGVSVDMMIYENQRVRLQNVADRAALAAADMQQTLPPQTVVRSYFERAGLADKLTGITVVNAFNERAVTVTTSDEMPTIFMNMTGTPTLRHNILASAREGIEKIEISMVLDVSGSMGWPSASAGGATRLSDMKDAASTFVDLIHGSAASDGATVSLVPYSTQVNAGAEILSRMNVTAEHGFSHCIEFGAADFLLPGILTERLYQRAGHFDMWSDRSTPWRRVCPTGEVNRISALMNDPAAVKARIAALEADGQTSIETGLKWGALMLDPGFRTVSASLPEVAPENRDRPYDYGQRGATKFLVLLTDGINTAHKRLNAGFLGGPSIAWRYEPQGEPLETLFADKVKFSRSDTLAGPVISLARPEIGDADGDGIPLEPFWLPRTVTREGEVIEAQFVSAPFGTQLSLSKSLPDTNLPPYQVRQLDWPELWAQMPVKHFAERYIREIADSRTERDLFYAAAWRDVGGTEKNLRMSEICGALRSTGVTVFVVGFEVEDAAVPVLETCASTPNHFVRADSTDLTQAFSAIASNITTLRLTQ